ncbi:MULTISPECIES: chorismate mutase [Streptomyces albovinaceus subgroup]|uniref:chorismate mutase n=1 Tax=Streptomyces albovinaceus subgroup TaxID=1482558 RepID=UPI0004C81A0F|nr:MULTISPECIES: chorismate mutase [Streptomyces albovinaceus subgroup]
MAVRGLRGAVQLREDSEDAVVDGTKRLLKDMLDANGVGHDDLVSVLFTATPDLRSAFPAAAAREAGMADTPLMCAQELDVPGALPRVVRILAHAETELPKRDIHHVYLDGAAVLRPDQAARPGGSE